METSLKERIEMLESISELRDNEIKAETKKYKKRTSAILVFLYVLVILNTIGVIQVKKRVAKHQQQVHQSQQ